MLWLGRRFRQCMDERIDEIDNIERHLEDDWTMREVRQFLKLHRAGMAKARDRG